NRSVSHLVFPDEVQVRPAADGRPSGPSGRVPNQETAPPDDEMQQALDLIAGAKRPAIIVGHGARFDMPAVRGLAEVLDAPVLTTFKAKGLVSDHHPLGCGVLGRSGTPVASWMMNESDLLLVFGASFSNHTGIADYKPIIQVDTEPAALGRFHAVTSPVLGDIATTARRLAHEIAIGTASATPVD